MFTAIGSHNKTNEIFQDALERTGIAEKNRGNAYAFGFNGQEKFKKCVSTTGTYLVNQVEDLQ